MITRGFDKSLYVLPFDHRGSFATRMFGVKVAPHVDTGSCAAQFGPRLGLEYTYPSTPKI
jgi:hypothetical protein